jgi:threonine dehydrogenase-like Zn-dependent dehydrogenase
MKAITLTPLVEGSVSLEDIAEPDPASGSVLVQTVAVGVCGTDIEIISGQYGWAPPGSEKLVLGHESIGKVLEAPEGSGLAKGDLVVGIVRRPDPVPCYSCAVGEWDNCHNGMYSEHGIKELDGFMRERYRADVSALVKVDPGLGKLGVLLEPTTIVAKAWEDVNKIGNRSHWEPKTALITGAGPVGLLAALLGRQAGLEVHVIDQVTSGIKPELVSMIGATYHSVDMKEALSEPDIIIECTGVPALVFEATQQVGTGGVVCLTGVSSTGHTTDIDVGAWNRDLVLSNKAIVGSVNANRRHYEAASEALSKAPREFLEKMITKSVAFTDYKEAFNHGTADVKVVIDFSDV